MHTTTPIDDIRPLTNPGTLINGDHHTSKVVAEKDQAHFETRDGIAGFAAIGITNADGEVLLESTSDGQFWRLPHSPVETGDDYVAHIEHAVEETLGVEILVRSVVGVRRVDAVLQNSTAAEEVSEGATARALSGLDGQTVCHDIVFEAQLDGVTDSDSMMDTHGTDSTTEWFDSVPDGAPPGLPSDDIALFVG